MSTEAMRVTQATISIVKSCRPETTDEEIAQLERDGKIVIVDEKKACENNGGRTPKN
jgi:hypothetical protein